MTQALLPPLEDAWADFARSRSRKGRSVHTLNIYRKSYEQFRRWAETEGLLPDPGAITHRQVKAWTSAMLAAPLVRNGNVTFDVDPNTGERLPRPIQPNTVRIRWQNLRPFFSWWAEEMEEPNPFDAFMRLLRLHRVLPVRIGLSTKGAFCHTSYLGG